MKSNFQALFSIEVFHSYYERNICKCLQFKPGPVTSVLFERFDFKMRENINGFEFYMNSRSSISGLLNYIKDITGNDYFDFNIVTSTPEFYLFTDVPANNTERLTYSSRLISNNSTDAIQLTPIVSQGVNPVYAGVLTIYFDDIIRLSEKGPVNYCISYKARATQWQYYVINVSSAQLSNPAVTGKNDISFTGPESVVLENGQQALLFSSGDHLIPLSVVPEYKFDLVNNPVMAGNTGNKSPGAKTVFKGLPVPGPMQMSTTANEGQLSSPMYVYI